jgi:hypothetical protein
MSVKWRGEDGKATHLLQARNDIKNLAPVASGVTFEFQGEADALDALLRELVMQDVRITEWRALSDDLEQIFLRSGAKELM